MPETTEAPATPVPFRLETFKTVIPPMAVTGIGTERQIAVSCSRVKGTASFFVGLGKMLRSLYNPPHPYMPFFCLTYIFSSNAQNAVRAD